MTRQIKTDLALLPSSILSILTGFALHAAGHAASLSAFRAWAMAHLIASLTFLILGWLHIVQHKTWYASLRKRQRRHHPIPIGLTIGFIGLATTGAALMFSNGQAHTLGIRHYQLGILMSLLVLAHILKHLKALKKALNGMNKIRPKT